MKPQLVAHISLTIQVSKVALPNFEHSPDDIPPIKALKYDPGLG